MSAQNIYQPHFYIDGQHLTETAPVGDLAAVADFKIAWGGKDWFENVEPSTLTCTLLDPYGDFAKTGPGSTIRITRDDTAAAEVPVWDGTVDEITSTFGRTTDPRTGESRDMWTHRIKAFDPLGAMARDRRRGPTYPDSYVVSPNHHWGPCFQEQRTVQVSARSPVPIEWPPAWIDAAVNASGSNFLNPVPGYDFSQVVSLLTVLRNTGRAHGVFQRPYYRPDRQAVAFYGPPQLQAAAIGFGQSEEGYQLEERPGGGEPIVLLSGSDFTTGGPLTASNSAVEAATQAELMTRWTKPVEGETTAKRYYENVEESLNINAVSRAGSQLTIQVELDIRTVYLEDSFRISPPIPATLKLRELLTSNASGPLRAAYGLPRLDPLVYKFDKHGSAPAWAVPFLTPAPVEHNPGNEYVLPLVFHQLHHLIESHTSMLAPTFFAIVGGELSYSNKHGWQARLFPALTRTRIEVANGPYPTLGDVTSDAEIQDCLDESFVADWQHIDHTS